MMEFFVKIANGEKLYNFFLKKSFIMEASTFRVRGVRS